MPAGAFYVPNPRRPHPIPTQSHLPPLTISRKGFNKGKFFPCLCLRIRTALRGKFRPNIRFLVQYATYIYYLAIYYLQFTDAWRKENRK